MKPTSLGCIYLIDEFLWNDYFPWRESLLSVMSVVDELVIVKGVRKYSAASGTVKDFLDSLDGSKVKVVEYGWPDNFSWFDIAHALNVGLLQCESDWCFRLLMDEVIPVEDFRDVRTVLSECGRCDVVTVGRYYLLGDSRVFPYTEKELFFRNKKDLVFGRVDAENGTMPLLFDNPVRIAESKKFFSLDADGYMAQYPKYPPLGGRESAAHEAGRSGKFIINTDVNFLPDVMLARQKTESAKGYLNLPLEYQVKYAAGRETDVVSGHVAKIRKMLDQPEKAIEIDLPDGLRRFAGRFDCQHNSVQKIFHEYFNR